MTNQYIIAFHCSENAIMSGTERVNGKTVTYSDLDKAALAAGTLNQRADQTRAAAPAGVYGKTSYEVRKNPTEADSMGSPLNADESARVRAVYQQHFASQRRRTAVAGQTHKL